MTGPPVRCRSMAPYGVPLSLAEPAGGYGICGTKSEQDRSAQVLADTSGPDSRSPLNVVRQSKATLDPMMTTRRTAPRHYGLSATAMGIYSCDQDARKTERISALRTDER
jgi:hypothetical protein